MSMTFKGGVFDFGDTRSIPVMEEVTRKMNAGGVVKFPTGVEARIPAGTLAYQDNISGGIVTPIFTFKVISHSSTSDAQTVVVEPQGTNFRPIAGMFLMRLPSSITTSGTGVEVLTTGELAPDGESVSFDVAVGSFGTLNAGDILISVDSAGSGKRIQKPIGHIWHDVISTKDTNALSTTIVLAAKVYEDRIQPVPDMIKEVLPMIHYVKEVK